MSVEKRSIMGFHEEFNLNMSTADTLRLLPINLSKFHIAQVCQLSPCRHTYIFIFGSVVLLAFPKAEDAFEMDENFDREQD